MMQFFIYFFSVSTLTFFSLDSLECSLLFNNGFCFIYSTFFLSFSIKIDVVVVWISQFNVSTRLEIYLWVYSSLFTNPHISSISRSVNQLFFQMNLVWFLTCCIRFIWFYSGPHHPFPISCLCRITFKIRADNICFFAWIFLWVLYIRKWNICKMTTRCTMLTIKGASTDYYT